MKRIIQPLQVRLTSAKDGVCTGNAKTKIFEGLRMVSIDEMQREEIEVRNIVKVVDPQRLF